MASEADEFKRQVETLKSKIANGTLTSAGEILSAHEALKYQLQGNKLFQSISRENQENPELWETSCEVLVEIIMSYNKLVHTLIEKVKAIEDQSASIQSRLKELEEKFRVLQKSEKELKESQVKLMVGQLAFEINRAVVHKVLDGILDPDEEQINTIGDMEKAFKGKSNFDDIFEKEEDMKRAEEKWETLKREIKWKGVYYRYLKKLKNFRLDIAHPTFDHKAMKQAALSGTLQVPESDVKLFSECLAIYDRLSQLSDNH